MAKNITLISSTGGHLSQLLKIAEFLSDQEIADLNYQVVTEKQETTLFLKEKYLVYYLKQQERQSLLFPFIFLYNMLISLSIILKERPEFVISTGAGAVVPFCLISKLFGAKLIFVESFAKVNSPTITGRILYRFSDRFYVQWESMTKFYPDSIYKGGLY
ncbi:PssD/Cps14F family polysaccharide biosynthesis glycosyltransferase [Rossellomorea vietnamensis]|uniref:PssD/Cps14F family polysaccharide biosynthesis glycosyltransferase n=1 Tax=Rossellomorea vietnamensis TaxID=218284 RepID=UPI003CE84CCC